MLFSSDIKALEIPFECVYPNQAEASLVRMNIEQAEVITLTPEDGSGTFELGMSIFKVGNTNWVRGVQ